MAGNIQLLIQNWPNTYFGGTIAISVTVSDQLLAANTWQTFKVNIGSITTGSPTGATWQLSYQMIASQWGGVGFPSTLAIDNLTLTHLANPLTLASSANPSAHARPR